MTFDKSNWKAVTFGEVCRNVNDNEREPLGAGIERYVGLEDIEPENLHIRSWGNVADGTTFTKVFRPGHVFLANAGLTRKKPLWLILRAFAPAIFWCWSRIHQRLISGFSHFWCKATAFLILPYRPPLARFLLVPNSRTSPNSNSFFPPKTSRRG